MMPFIFMKDTEDLGVRITRPEEFEALNSADCVTRESLHEKTSLKIKFGWHGYKEVKMQIQFGNELLTARRLAILVAEKVKSFMEKEMDNSSEDSRSCWVIGKKLGQISADDVILLGIVFVSPGAVMPLLRLRPDFEFASIEPVLPNQEP